MAISGGDGSIILTTKVDTKGLDAAMAKMRQQAKGTGSAFESLSNFIKIQETRLASLRQQYASYVLKNEQSSVAAKKLARDIKNLSTSLTQNQARLNAASASAVSFGAKAKTAIAGVGASLKVLASYLIGIQTIFAVINFSKQAGEFATQTEASVQRLVDIYGEAAQSVGDFIDANARSIGMSKSAGASIAATYGNLLSVWADQATNAELTNSLLNQTAVVASKTGRTTTDVAERIRSGLLGNTEAIEDLGINVNIKTIEITDAFKRIADGRSWEQLNAYEQSQVRALAILEQSTNKYGTTVAETSATVRNQYQAAYEDFKNTWGQVVNTVLIPVLKILTQVFTIATKGLQVMAGLSGKTVKNSEETSSNIKQQTKEQEKLNKALKKGLASFDEINILTEQSAENTAGAGTGTQVSGVGDVGGNYDNSFVDKVSGDMAAIMAIVGGALVAIGLVLIFFGKVGWGIGFIIAGAAIFGVSMASISSSDQVTPISEKLMAIMATAGIALTAIGLILLFGGNWKWGIGFIIAGASIFSIAVVAVKSGNATEGAKQMLLDIMLIAGAAMLALGIILLLCGVISPLSIGLVVAGAATLAGATAINPQAVGAKIKKFFIDNAGLIIGVASAILVLGVVLCLCGIITPLTIGMIVSGGALLATEATLNWEGTKETIKNFFKDNSGLIIGVASAILVLGVILCLVGIITPLTIGMIVAGSALLATEATLNWEETKNTIKNFFTENAGLIVGISLAILVLGIILCACGIITPLTIGMIVFGAAGLASTVVLNWNAITTAISDFFKNNAGLVVGISLALLVLGILLLVTGVGIPLGIGLVMAGVAGLVTEVVLNWNAIKEKVSTAIKAVIDWVKTYGLLVLGILLCLTGVGIPLGIALIVKWAKDGVKNGVPLANVIVDKVKQVWNSVKQFWNTHIAPIFTAKWWADLGKKAINGLISGFEGGINGIIGAFESMINWIVDGLNKISFDIPDWLGGGSFGINLPRANFGRVKIPRLAQGSVIPPNKEFMAILGDNTKEHEIVSPISTMKQAFTEAMLEMGGNFGGGNTEVVLEIDGREFGRAVVEQGNKENRRIGTRLVIA